MQPIGQEGSDGGAQRGRSLISAIVLFQVCREYRLILVLVSPA